METKEVINIIKDSGYFYNPLPDNDENYRDTYIITAVNNDNIKIINRSVDFGNICSFGEYIYYYFGYNLFKYLTNITPELLKNIKKLDISFCIVGVLPFENSYNEDQKNINVHKYVVENDIKNIFKDIDADIFVRIDESKNVKNWNLIQKEISNIFRCKLIDILFDIKSIILDKRNQYYHYDVNRYKYNKLCDMTHTIFKYSNGQTIDKLKNLQCIELSNIINKFLYYKQSNMSSRIQLYYMLKNEDLSKVDKEYIKIMLTFYEFFTTISNEYSIDEVKRKFNDWKICNILEEEIATINWMISKINNKRKLISLGPIRAFNRQCVRQELRELDLEKYPKN